MEQFDPRIDAYIAQSADFAKPVLEYIRQVVHDASPLIMETVKWSMPFFDYKGTICQMAAFKQHCAFGFWKASRLNDPHQKLRIGEQSAGSFSRLITIADLPSKEILTDFIRQAMALNEGGKVSAIKKIVVPKTAVAIPNYFLDFLANHPKANETFEKFSPSHRKEYIQWIIDAKTDTTRQKRMVQAVEMMSEGKSKNWKYQTP